MQPTSPAVYRENRARFPLSELRKYDGQWVAFNMDGREIVGSAPTIAELASRLQAHQRALCDVVLERIDMEVSDSFVGGAELL